MPRIVSQDVHVAGGAPLVKPEELGLGRAEFQVRLDAPNETLRLNGHLIMGLARTAVDEGDQRELGLLAAAFHQLVLRLPEVHGYLDSLPREDAEVTAGLRVRRGRPRELRHHLSYVYTLDRLADARKCSIAKAAEVLAPHTSVTQARLRTMHSELAHLAHVFAAGLFVSGAVHTLMPLEWGQSPMTTVEVYDLG